MPQSNERAELSQSIQRSANGSEPNQGDQRIKTDAAAAIAPDRRRFLAGSATMSLAAGLAAHSNVHAQGDAEPAKSPGDATRIALVGAGGRGGGAVGNSMDINGGNVNLVAIADVDDRKPAVLSRSMARKHPNLVRIDDDKLYSGYDGYKRILDDDSVDVVLFATPPGFRPQHILDAVDAGKHVFAEKPTCVDPHGYRTCLEAHEKAVSNKTAIVTGTQYRRQTNYMEAIGKIHEGAIGDVIGATSRYCSNGIWYRARKPEMTDLQYQVYNWMHFVWLSGDQIAEQAVHNIDLMNWLMKGPPESAFGGGGRFTRPEDSEMWDSMSIDYRYPGNKFISFKCRQIPDAQYANATEIFGSNGRAEIRGGDAGATIWDKDGNESWSMKGDIGSAYKQEHKDLIDSIRSGKPIVELAETAMSSLTAVMGRMAAYSGQNVTWDFVTKESELNLFPADLTSDADVESSHAIPGKTKLT